MVLLLSCRVPNVQLDSSFANINFFVEETCIDCTHLVFVKYAVYESKWDWSFADTSYRNNKESKSSVLKGARLVFSISFVEHNFHKMWKQTFRGLWRNRWPFSSRNSACRRKLWGRVLIKAYSAAWGWLVEVNLPSPRTTIFRASPLLSTIE